MMLIYILMLFDEPVADTCAGWSIYRAIITKVNRNSHKKYKNNTTKPIYLSGRTHGPCG